MSDTVLFQTHLVLGYVAWLLEGVTLLNRAPALAVMDYLPPD